MCTRFLFYNYKERKMNKYFIETLERLSIHKVGHKTNEEGMILAKENTQLDKNLKSILIDYFVNSFKSDEYFNFYHDIDINMNEAYVCASKIFDNPNTLLEQSIYLAKHLYEQSIHPRIKGGEFYTAYFKDCIIMGETVDVIGLFKSENKDIFLNVYPKENSFKVESEKGINVNKLDKGCLIFNIEKEKGYIVAVIDNINKGVEAQYWMNDFLHVHQREDEYFNTKQIISLCKNFIKNELPQQFDVSKADQIDMINKSISFFKERDNFDFEDFINEVIAQPEMIESFNQYKKEFQQNNDIEIADNFTISENAMKKQSRSLKSVIKLDKNFDIHIHGNRNMLEQGVDEKGKYYKMYYHEEL